MASRTMNARAKEFGADVKVIRAKISPAGSSTPTVVSNGGVASAERVSAGKFRLKLSDRYYKLLAFHCTWSDDSDGVDLYAQAGAVTLNDTTNNSGNTSAIVKLKTGATNTDNAASATDDVLYVTLVFEDSASYD